MTTPNLNQLAPISDFDNAYVLAQQAHEQGFRGSTFADLYLWLKTKLDVLGLSNTAGLPEEFPQDGDILSAADAGQWTILGPGIYHQPGYPSIEVAEGKVVFAQFDGTQFSIQREVEMPRVDTDNLIKDEDLDLVFGNQLFDGQKITGFYINLNGDVTPYINGSYGVVDLTDKGHSKYITINGLPLSTVLAKFYSFQDASGAVLHHGRLDPAEPKTLSIPDDAVKFLFTIDVASSVIDPQTIMINYGIEAKEWGPYLATVEKIKNNPIKYPVFSKKIVQTNNLVSDNIEPFALVINTTGFLAKTSSNWHVAWKMPTNSNPNLYIKGLNTSATSYVSFFTGEVPTENTFTTGQYDSFLLSKVNFTKTNGEATVAIPEGSTWFAVNVKNNTEDESVYENLFISYTPIDNNEPVRDEEFIYKIDDHRIASEVIVRGDNVISANDLALKSDISTNSDVTLLKDGYNLAIRIPFNSNEDLVHRWQQKNANGVFNSLGVYSVSKTTSDDDILSVGTIVHLFNDNIAPIFFKTLVTATGNHGVALPIATVSGGHDKTEDDLFSIWSTPSDEYYLVEIISETQLRFLGRARPDGSIPRSISSTITHVSGGTNTSAIIATGVTEVEVKPAMRQDMIQNIVLDGKNITSDGVHKGEVVEFVEIANVPDWREPTLVAPFDVTNAPTMIQNRITYRYDRTNTLGIDYVMNFVRNFPLAYNGFFQSQIFNPTGRTRNDIYFPNSNVYGGKDFRTKVNLTNALGTDVIINNSNVENPDKPVQRCIQIATVGGVNKYGYAHGYAYDIGKSRQDERSSLYRQWELRGSSGKSYPRALWEFEPNFDVLHVSAYCQYFDPTLNPDATSVYVHKEGDSYYVYMDFHNATPKAIINLPDYVHGKSLEAVDVQGVTLLSGNVIPHTGVFVSVELQNGYAYGVFKTN